jgi:hypothetical protein
MKNGFSNQRVGIEKKERVRRGEREIARDLNAAKSQFVMSRSGTMADVIQIAAE